MTVSDNEKLPKAAEAASPQDEQKLPIDISAASEGAQEGAASVDDSAKQPAADVQQPTQQEPAASVPPESAPQPAVAQPAAPQETAPAPQATAGQGLSERLAAIPEIDATQTAETTTAPSAGAVPMQTLAAVTPNPVADAADASASLGGMAPNTTIFPEERRKSKAPLVIALVVALLAAGYAAGAVAFSNMFYPNTTLNGKDVSFKSVGDVAAENSASVSEFSFSVSGDNVNATVSATDINAAYDGEGFAKEAISEQHPWSWPMEVFGQHVLTVESGMSYDAERLEELIGQAVDAANNGAKESKNAEAAYDSEAGRYKIVPEEQGTTVDKALVLDAVHKAIDTDQPTLALDESYLLKPSITKDDDNLKAAIERVNGCIEASQDLVTHDQTVFVVNEHELKEWVGLADDYSIIFDLDACIKWAKSTLSEKLDSRGATRSYKRPDGKEITVSGGTYGWVIDGEAIAHQIAENVRAGKKSTIEVVFSQEAAEWNPGGKDWGSRYIDIDLSEQHVRLYEGEDYIWESDCVSGGLNQGKMHNTPTGVYFINDNMQSGNVELRGEIDPATNEPEYISYVTYWMPFIDNGYALHDADWRGAFGGDIYLSNGSHGCVNLPPDAAASLYGMVSVGTVVVVHD